MEYPNVLPPSNASGTPVSQRLGRFPVHDRLPDRDEIYDRMEKEERHHWVGPMSKEEFFSKYMHLDADVELPTIPKDYFNGVPKGGLEVDMYEPLINLIHRANLGNSTFEFINTSAHADPNSLFYKKIQPDISTHHTKDEEDRDPDQKNRTAFYKQQLPFELKTGKLSPFLDPPKDCTDEQRLKHPFENVSQDARDLRGQMATVLAEMSARQFRTHAFMVFMNETEVRFLRTDRTATIVTEAINYRTDSDVVAEFLARFSHMTDAQRGVDETVKPAKPKDIEEARQLLQHYQKEPERFLPWVAIQVPTLDGSVREVIAREPMSEPDSLTGRSTRAFPVYDLREKKVMFLKDTWRADLPGMDRETEILRLLNEAGVEHVPKLVDGGDVHGEYHNTQSHLSEEAPWRAGPLAPLVPRAHHRFLEDFLGIDLARFRKPKELFQVVADAFEAHCQALHKCGILHRDVSVNNIMIGAGGRGVLNDWDMAKRVGIPGQTPPPPPPEALKRHCYRTGTWYFLSALMLINPIKIHTLQDDIESFFYVIFYYGLHFLHHNLDDEEVQRIISKVFQESSYDHVLRQFTGGDGKRAMIMHRRYITQRFTFTDNPALSHWFDDARKALASYHKWVDSVEEFRLAELDAKAKGYPIDEDDRPAPPESLKLASHSYFRQLFISGLARNDWSSKRLGVLDGVDAQPPARTRGSLKRPRPADVDDFPDSPSKRPNSSSIKFRIFAKSI
ncbi:unnamed protein product [Cyclocybe aegerita]|uniref:Protein kinase domain-containing protein n=1 Tax=Cyclocybe aegerita TaxID=1973307 RepID=A0A8S0WRP9_CYCAE|nr:unnamed protein product [Cyclocybe aegerita]